MSSASDALRASALIEGIQFGGNHLHTNISKLPSGNYTVKVFNIPSSEADNDNDMEKSILAALSVDDVLEVSNISKNTTNSKSIQLRFPSSTSEQTIQTIKAAITNVRMVFFRHLS